jgi:hypothetical protein
MFLTTVAFLIFCTSTFASVEYIFLSLTNAVIGADIALLRFDGQGPVSLEEYKLREYFESNLFANGDGIIAKYGFVSHFLNEIMVNQNGNNMYVGLGIVGLDDFEIELFGVERNHLDFMTNEYFYPTEVFKPPVGRTYRDD